MADKKEKTEEELDQEYLIAYQDICTKFNRVLKARPDWRFSTDGNDWRMTLLMQVARMENNDL